MNKSLHLSFLLSVVVFCFSCKKGESNVAVVDTVAKAPETPLAPIGEIFNKKVFTTLAKDFTLTGAADGFSLNTDGNMVLQNGDGSFNKSIILKNTVSTDQKIKVSVYFKCSAITSTSYGFAIAAKSINAWVPASVVFAFNFDKARNGVIDLYKSDSGSPFMSNTDKFDILADTLYRADMELNGPQFKGTINKIDAYGKVLASKTLSFTAVYDDVQLFPKYNSKQIQIYARGGVQIVKQITYSSNSYHTPDVICLGDSKTDGYDAGDTTGTYPAITAALTGLKVSNYGANADRTIECLQSADYILANVKKAKFVTLCIGRNDIASYQPLPIWEANYGAVVAKARLMGTKLIHILPIPELVIGDQSNLWYYIKVIYPNDLMYDPAVGWDTATMLDQDKVHPTPLGMQHIAAGLAKVIMDNNKQ